MQLKSAISIILFTLLVSTANSQTVIPLYTGKAPGSEKWNWQERRLIQT